MQCSAGYDALFVGVTYRRRPAQAPSSGRPECRTTGEEMWRARAHTWDSSRSSGRGGGAQHRTAEQRESARGATSPAGAPGDDKRVAPPQDLNCRRWLVGHKVLTVGARWSSKQGNNSFPCATCIYAVPSLLYRSARTPNRRCPRAHVRLILCSSSASATYACAPPQRPCNMTCCMLPPAFYSSLWPH